MNYTEHIVLEKPIAVINSFLSYKSLRAGYLLRILARDARTRRVGRLLVQVLSPTMETKIGESPIVRFFKSDFALYANDRMTPIVLDNDNYIANASLSTFHIPRFGVLDQATEGIFCERDLSFENFDAKSEHVYMARIGMIEVFVQDKPNLDELNRMAQAFVMKVKRRDERIAEWNAKREERLKGELVVYTLQGFCTFRREEKNGNRFFVKENGEFMIVRILAIRNNRIIYEVRSGPDIGSVTQIDYIKINPDPNKEK